MSGSWSRFVDVRSLDSVSGPPPPLDWPLLCMLPGGAHCAGKPATFILRGLRTSLAIATYIKHLIHNPSALTEIVVTRHDSPRPPTLRVTAHWRFLDRRNVTSSAGEATAVEHCHRPRGKVSHVLPSRSFSRAGLWQEEVPRSKTTFRGAPFRAAAQQESRFPLGLQDHSRVLRGRGSAWRLGSLLC